MNERLADALAALIDDPAVPLGAALALADEWLLDAGEPGGRAAARPPGSALAHSRRGEQPRRYAEGWINTGQVGVSPSTGRPIYGWYNPITGQTEHQETMPGMGHAKGTMSGKGGDEDLAAAHGQFGGRSHLAAPAGLSPEALPAFHLLQGAPEDEEALGEGFAAHLAESLEHLPQEQVKSLADHVGVPAASGGAPRDEHVAALTGGADELSPTTDGGGEEEEAPQKSTPNNVEEANRRAAAGRLRPGAPGRQEQDDEEAGHGTPAARPTQVRPRGPVTRLAPLGAGQLGTPMPPDPPVLGDDASEKDWEKATRGYENRGRWLERARRAAEADEAANPPPQAQGDDDEADDLAPMTEGQGGEEGEQTPPPKSTPGHVEEANRRAREVAGLPDHERQGAPATSGQPAGVRPTEVRRQVGAQAPRTQLAPAGHGQVGTPMPPLLPPMPPAGSTMKQYDDWLKAQRRAVDWVGAARDAAAADARRNPPPADLTPMTEGRQGGGEQPPTPGHVEERHRREDEPRRIARAEQARAAAAEQERERKRQQQEEGEEDVWPPLAPGETPRRPVGGRKTGMPRAVADRLGGLNNAGRTQIAPRGHGQVGRERPADTPLPPEPPPGGRRTAAEEKARRQWGEFPQRLREWEQEAREAADADEAANASPEQREWQRRMREIDRVARDLRGMKIAGRQPTQLAPEDWQPPPPEEEEEEEGGGDDLAPFTPRTHGGGRDDQDERGVADHGRDDEDDGAPPGAGPQTAGGRRQPRRTDLMPGETPYPEGEGGPRRRDTDSDDSSRQMGWHLRRQTEGDAPPSADDVRRGQAHLSWLADQHPDEVARLWEGFTGRPPAPGSDPHALVRRVLHAWGAPRLPGVKPTEALGEHPDAPGGFRDGPWWDRREQGAAPSGQQEQVEPAATTTAAAPPAYPEPPAAEELYSATYRPVSSDEPTFNEQAGGIGTVRTADGKDYFWKTPWDEEYDDAAGGAAGREELVARALHALGAPAPAAWKMPRRPGPDAGREGGVLMPLLGEARPKFVEELENEGAPFEALSRRLGGTADAQRHFLAAFLLNLGDRHANNFMIDDGGRLHSIDHEFGLFEPFTLAFLHPGLGRTVRAEWRTPGSQELARALFLGDRDWDEAGMMANGGLTEAGRVAFGRPGDTVGDAAARAKRPAECSFDPEVLAGLVARAPAAAEALRAGGKELSADRLLSHAAVLRAMLDSGKYTGDEMIRLAGLAESGDLPAAAAEGGGADDEGGGLVRPRAGGDVATLGGRQAPGGPRAAGGGGPAPGAGVQSPRPAPGGTAGHPAGPPARPLVGEGSEVGRQEEPVELGEDAVVEDEDGHDAALAAGRALAKRLGVDLEAKARRSLEKGRDVDAFMAEKVRGGTAEDRASIRRFYEAMLAAAQEKGGARPRAAQAPPADSSGAPPASGDGGVSPPRHLAAGRDDLARRRAALEVRTRELDARIGAADELADFAHSRDGVTQRVREWAEVGPDEDDFGDEAIRRRFVGASRALAKVVPSDVEASARDLASRLRDLAAPARLVQAAEKAGAAGAAACRRAAGHVAGAAERLAPLAAHVALMEAYLERLMASEPDEPSQDADDAEHEDHEEAIERWQAEVDEADAALDGWQARLGAAREEFDGAMETLDAVEDDWAERLAAVARRGSEVLTGSLSDEEEKIHDEWEALDREEIALDEEDEDEEEEEEAEAEAEAEADDGSGGVQAPPEPGATPGKQARTPNQPPPPAAAAPTYDPARRLDLWSALGAVPLDEATLADLAAAGFDARASHRQAASRNADKGALARLRQRGLVVPMMPLLSDSGVASLAVLNGRHEEPYADPTTAQDADLLAHAYKTLGADGREAMRRHFGLSDASKTPEAFRDAMLEVASAANNPVPVDRLVSGDVESREAAEALRRLDRAEKESLWALDGAVAAHDRAMARLQQAGGTASATEAHRRAVADARREVEMAQARADEDEAQRVGRARRALLAPADREVARLSRGPAVGGRVTPEHLARLDEALGRLHGVVVGGSLPDFSVTLDQDRASYDYARRLLNVGAQDGEAGVRSQLHELGHHLENVLPGARAACLAFLRHRTRGETPRRLDELFPDAGYSEEEVGRLDRFDAAFGRRGWYAGKAYDDGSTEVLSMGVEALLSDPVGFARADPEYCAFVVGVLHGRVRMKDVPGTVSPGAGGGGGGGRATAQAPVADREGQSQSALPIEQDPLSGFDRLAERELRRRPPGGVTGPTSPATNLEYGFHNGYGKPLERLPLVGGLKYQPSAEEVLAAGGADDPDGWAASALRSPSAEEREVVRAFLEGDHSLTPYALDVMADHGMPPGVREEVFDGVVFGHWANAAAQRRWHELFARAAQDGGDVASAPLLGEEDVDRLLPKTYYVDGTEHGAVSKALMPHVLRKDPLRFVDPPASPSSYRTPLLKRVARRLGLRRDQASPGPTPTPADRVLTRGQPSAADYEQDARRRAEGESEYRTPRQIREHLGTGSASSGEVAPPPRNHHERLLARLADDARRRGDEDSARIYESQIPKPPPPGVAY